VKTQEQIVKDTFIQYSDAFAKLDPKALVPFYYQPAILIDSNNIASFKSEAEILAVLTPLIEGLKKVGYDHSETDQLTAKLLSKNTALVSGIGTRLKKDGSKLGQFGFTYTLRKTDTDWKIIAGIIHETETALQLEGKGFYGS
jgi:ketosteroid isomerase-like protein